MRTRSLIAGLTIVVLMQVGCGGTSDTETDPVDTGKLLGTPFEGLTKGDDIGWCQLQEGQYLTTVVPSFPISIFLAFFTASEEEEVREGVRIANDSAGLEVFILTDTWSDEARVIYKVADIFDAEKAGHLDEDFFHAAAAKTLSVDFNAEGKANSDLVVTDWQIEVADNPYSSYVNVIAHELGHALGIRAHALIDYENDELLPLEDGSIMGKYGGSVLNDYSFMMRKQVELYRRHSGEEIINPGGICYDRVPSASEEGPD